MKRIFKKGIVGFIALLFVVTIITPAAVNGATKRIGKTKAKSIALADAGLKSSEVTFTKVKLDKEDGITVYEVDFYHGTDEYDYEIHATSGKILKSDFSDEGYSDTGSNKSNISKSKAKSIALKHAGLKSSQVTFTKVKLDTDDGISIYEIDFSTDKAEYDYEIAAKTGKILQADYEALDEEDSSNGTKITAAKAKQIALKHAGFTESEVSQLKCKKDTDDGITVYEVEFKKGSVEYEYEINANTGKIISWDSDIDD